MIGKEKYAWTKTTGDLLAMWAAAFVLSLAQWRHTVYFFGNCDALAKCDMSDVVRSLRAEVGILQGYPYWRYFQSRLLGPWLEKILHLLFGFNFMVSHMIVAIAALTLSGVAIFHAGRAIGGRQSGWSALLALQLLFALMMARPWLYIWDYFVILVGALFLLLVTRRAPWWSFLLLMSAAFFNHESALFIGVWMVAKALSDAWAERHVPDWRMLGGGVLGSVGGIVLIELLRMSLMNRETGWEVFGDVGNGPTSQFDAYFHVQIAANLHDIYQWVTQPNFDLLFLIPVPLVVMLALACILVVRHGMKAAALAAYAVAQVAALLTLGMRAETRDLLQLVPFLCVGGMLAARSDWDTPLAMGQAQANQLAATVSRHSMAAAKL
jgi:hypothetical protein